MLKTISEEIVNLDKKSEYISVEPEILSGNTQLTHIVQKSKPLLLMRKIPFELGELKILDTYISRINSHDETHRTVVFTKSEYEMLMGVAECKTKTLKKYTEQMLGKVVEVPYPDEDGTFDSDKYRQIVLFTESICDRNEFGERIIILTCSPEAKSLFFNIEGLGYLKYELKNVLQLTSKYSYFLYLYLRNERFKGTWTIELDSLKQMLNLQSVKSYETFKYFKRDILDKAVKEINLKTDISYEYKTIKQYKKVIAIRFSLVKDNSNSIQDDSQMQQLDTEASNMLSIANTTNTYNNDCIDYTNYIAELSEVCNYEFKEIQIQEIITLIELSGCIDDTAYKILYLKSMYTALNIRCNRDDLEPIKSRYSYLKKIIKEDLSQRAAKKKSDEQAEKKEYSFEIEEYKKLVNNFK